MAKRKSKQDRQSVTESTDRYTSVLLEGIRNDFKTVAESVQMTNESLQRLDHRVGQVDERIDHLEDSLHAEIIKTKQDLKTYLVEMKQDLKQEIVGELSKRFDPIYTRLDQHEQDIHRLKEAVHIS